jgi:hypothetical protein
VHLQVIRTLFASRLFMLAIVGAVIYVLMQVAVGEGQTPPQPDKAQLLLTPQATMDPLAAQATTAALKATMERFRADRERWLESLNQAVQQGTIDVSKLKRVTGNVTIEPPRGRTVPEAVRASAAVVMGSVVGVRYNQYSTHLTFRIEDVAKGDALPPEITLVFPLGAEPDLEANGDGQPVVTYVEGLPPLFKGDRAVVMLSPGPDGTYFPLTYVGVYSLDRGTGLAQVDVGENPIGRNLQHLTGPALMRVFREAAAR